MNEYKIRPALAEDCSYIYGLMRQLVEFRNYTLKVNLEDFIENGFGDGHPPYFHVIVVGKCDDRSIVGYLLYYHSYSSCEGKSLFMENIYVDPNHRGKGLASALLEYLCRFAAENKFMRIESCIYKLNEPSVKLHQAFSAVDLHETHCLLPYRIDSEAIRKAAEKPPRLRIDEMEKKSKSNDRRNCCQLLLSLLRTVKSVNISHIDSLEEKSFIQLTIFQISR